MVALVSARDRAGGRLVEEQELRALHDAHGELEPALVAAAEAVGDLPALRAIPTSPSASCAARRICRWPVKAEDDARLVDLVRLPPDQRDAVEGDSALSHHNEGVSSVDLPAPLGR